MNHFRLFLFCFICPILFFTACKKKVVFNEVKVNDTYSIVVPDYLSAGAKMHPQASLQYKNEEKEIYLLVIDESKETMTVGFC